MLGRFHTVAAAALLGALGLMSVMAAKSGAAASPLPIERNSPAPEFTGTGQWLNSPPLTMQQLRGKVVLVDFWTYTCINCIDTLPYVEGWYQKYKDQGLVVVGVHTPEYPIERDAGKLGEAIKKYGLTYPVVQDNDYATWNAYGNQYWPATYLIDKKGRVVYSHFGEGDYEVTEAAIRKQLAQAQ
jgi:thiol-disulfide isomerase/thioredoxin